MSRARVERRFSIVARIAGANALLFTVAALVSFAGSWLAARNGVEGAARERIDLEVAALTSELDKEGVEGAVAAIDWRSRRPGSLHYLLIDTRGNAHGDLTSAPRAAGWHRTKIVSHADRQQSFPEVLVQTRILPDGTVIAVGEDLEQWATMQKLLFSAMLPVGVVALLLSTLVSILTTARMLRRVDRIVAVVTAAEAGDFTARVDSQGKANDEFAFLGSAVNRMLDQTELLIATIRRVSAEIAHDLRTPLTHAKHAVASARWSDNPERRDKALELASDSLGRATRLFDGVLRLAEIDAGRMKGAFVSLSIPEIAEQALDVYRAETEATGRTIEMTADCGCRIMGNPDLLMQAVINLLDNALKHSAERAAIRLKLSRSDGLCTIAVENDASALSAADIRTALRPFGRLDRSRGTEGNGLGLPIAHSIARLHGGSIRIENIHGGVAIAIDIPSDPGQVQRTGAGSP